MATYRGSDGTLTYDTSDIAEFQDWELDLGREEIDTTKGGDTAKTFTLDISGATGRIRCNLDYGDTAQAALIDQLVAGASPTAATAKFNVSASNYFEASVLARGGRIVSTRGPNNVTVEFDVRVTGAVTVSWT